ncbi:uncharacterized protein BCR38DRAFT_503988 [Pseudomassariella vexata]|uniref:Zn(2)-C6 fungal-type domain-containing protein n=1 Tax=Pseudomassariella vexata TaxID=1141098 RepID=A0A1Y2EFT2_9PEZI|nr:uncharacterized protein BCR38DRAFT_503988 [Pseudomassariella vexata]ORY70430.1 hypothetical protein BCR38DRAFT_503988 [Pseudomassariella vexata]
MPPDRTARVCHNGWIPTNLFSNWQSSGSNRGGSKGLVRRPMTACESCREAKVKCTGQQKCHRCIARGLLCRYTAKTGPGISTLSAESVRRLPNDAVAWPSPIRTTSEEMPLEFNINAPDQSPPVHTPYVSGMGLESMPSADWVNEMPHHSMNDFDWRPIDPVLNSLARSSSLSVQNGVVSFASSCLCRANLMLLLPIVTSAMRDKRLDEIFKVTSEMMRGCQDLVDCTTCQVSCTDLLMMMTILQETSCCFEYIARSDLDGAVKITFGGYEVSSNDAKFRAMLVMDLVQRASTVLTSINSNCRSKVAELGDEPCTLAQANIAYLDATIGHFRSMLRCVAGYVTDSVDKSASASEAPLGVRLAQPPND